MKPASFINSFLVVLLWCAVAVQTANADVAPPPPQFPGTGIPAPPSPLVIVAGLLVLGAVVWAQKIRNRKREVSRPAWQSAPTIIVAVLTVFLSVASIMAERAYEERRSSWRSPGPPREPVPREVYGEETVGETLDENDRAETSDE